MSYKIDWTDVSSQINNLNAGSDNDVKIQRSGDNMTDLLSKGVQLKKACYPHILTMHTMLLYLENRTVHVVA